MPPAKQSQDESTLFRGCTRAEVARRMKTTEAEICRIENIFRLRLAIKLQQDPDTRHLAPRAFLAQFQNNSQS